MTTEQTAAPLPPRKKPTPRARQFFSTDVKIDQPRSVGNDGKRAPTIVQADPDILKNKEWLDRLAFMDEAVVIMIQRGGEKNASPLIPVWVNGQGAQLQLANGKWKSVTYLPTNVPITVKRKVVEVLLRSKRDDITTRIVEHQNDNPENKIDHSVTPQNGISLIHDPSPEGPAWFIDTMRMAA